MAIDGPLKSVLVVTEDELRVNGGRYLLQSGPAIKVRGYTEDTVGSRRIIHGDAQPVYVLGENDVRANGGRWLLKAGQPLRVTDVIGTARGVIQGKAIPVWPVDDDGNYDPDFVEVGFLPTDIATLELWVAADRGLSLADGNPVANWPDQSGNGNDLIQGVAANRPTFRTAVLNGLPIIRGDGINDLLAVNYALVQPVNLFIVAEYNVFNAFDTLHDGNAALRGRLYAIGVNQMRLHAGVGLTTGAIPLITSFRLYSCTINGATSEIRQDGVQQAAGNAGGVAPGGTTLFADGGGANHANADIAEAIVYSSVLSVTDRDLVETYLADKYGLTI